MSKQTNIKSKSVIQQLAIFCATMVFIATAYAHEQVKVVVVPSAGDDLRTIYEVGKTGPAGGIVFHVTDGGRHGLEASHEDQSPSAIWGCSGTDIPTMENIELSTTQDPNTGEFNTQAIKSGCEPGSAANIANSYEGPNGLTTGWYLPNKEELNLLYQQKDVVGNFIIGLYWSSSENDSVNAWAQSFGFGFQISNAKSSGGNVRAVRSF